MEGILTALDYIQRVRFAGSVDFMFNILKNYWTCLRVAESVSIPITVSEGSCFPPSCQHLLLFCDFCDQFLTIVILLSVE